MQSLDVFVGYDKAEPVAYHVCCESLISNSSKPLNIHPLYLPQLEMSLPKSKEGYPPSNGFIYSRFLVPELMSYTGKALFIDGDMVIEGDVAELFDMDMANLAVRVVKHDYTPSRNIKYLGSKNEPYPRKNWSSVILWNCGYYPNRQITRELLGKAHGSFLHRFQWLDDHEIGELPKEWNVLCDEPNQAKNPKLVHYTNGTPCFDEFKNCEYSALWHETRRSMNSHLETIS